MLIPLIEKRGRRWIARTTEQILSDCTNHIGDTDGHVLQCHAAIVMALHEYSHAVPGVSTVRERELIVLAADDLMARITEILLNERKQ